MAPRMSRPERLNKGGKTVYSTGMGPSVPKKNWDWLAGVA